MEQAKCKSCGAAILWLTNKQTGRLGPIDADSSADGNCLIDGDTYSVVPKGLFTAEGPRHMNHFATCPNARSHKKAARTQ